MNFEVLSFVFLESFNILQKKCDEIDEMVQRQCMLLIDINKIFNKIVKLNESKTALCNVKVVVVETLKNMKNNNFLVDKCIKNMTKENLSQKYNININAIGRKRDRNIKKFSQVMTKLFSQEFLINIYKTNSFIKNMYDSIIKCQRSKSYEINKAKENKNSEL